MSTDVELLFPGYKIVHGRERALYERSIDLSIDASNVKLSMLIESVQDLTTEIHYSKLYVCTKIIE